MLCKLLIKFVLKIVFYAIINIYYLDKSFQLFMILRTHLYMYIYVCMYVCLIN